MKVIRTALAVLALWLTPAVLPVTIIATFGVVDVFFLHGCIGVVLSTAAPWSAKYECVAQRY